MTARIAFLGIGLMGAPMAVNLLAAGHKLTLWNRTRSKAEALAPLGGRVAASAVEAVQDADLVVTMLESGPVVEAVLFGPEGAAAALKPGALVIDMSSIPPATARAHAARLKQRGVAYLDAPVSGGTVGAKEATLAIMVGGAPADFSRAKPVLSTLGRPTLVGPLGSGQLAKLCNQAIVAITIGAVSEALLLAAAGGADPAAVREALMGGFADSRILTLHGKRMIERDFRPGGRARIQVKDCQTILAAAKETGVELPLSARVAGLFEDLVAEGSGELDHSALLLELERLNTPKRVGTAPDKLPDQPK
jgi:2-hydroxy-3-oxopropionate reductase